MKCMISSWKFLDVLPVSMCASANANLRSICFVVKILSPLPFCCLLKLPNVYNEW